MINAKTLKQIQHAPVAERIHIIEEILQSLKQDMRTIEPTKEFQPRPFKARPFDLGTDIHIDRDIIYTERVF